MQPIAQAFILNFTMVEYSKLLTRNLSKKIEERGLTAEKVAYGAEIAKSTLSRILSGKISPTLGVLEKIANFLNVTICDLTKEEGNGKRP